MKNISEMTDKEFEEALKPILSTKAFWEELDLRKAREFFLDQLENNLRGSD